MKKVAPVLQLSCHVDVVKFEGMLDRDTAPRLARGGREIGDGSPRVMRTARQRLPQAVLPDAASARHGALKAM